MLETIEKEVEEDDLLTSEVNDRSPFGEGKINPLDKGIDLDGKRSKYTEIRCGCPCPKISAPIYAAGYVIFDPLS